MKIVMSFEEIKNSSSEIFTAVEEVAIATTDSVDMSKENAQILAESVSDIKTNTDDINEAIELDNQKQKTLYSQSKVLNQLKDLVVLSEENLALSY